MYTGSAQQVVHERCDCMNRGVDCYPVGSDHVVVGKKVMRKAFRDRVLRILFVIYCMHYIRLHKPPQNTFSLRIKVENCNVC
jgi:hypothetical protein